MQAGVTLFGTAAALVLGWDWADAVAASVVGLVAIWCRDRTRSDSRAYEASSRCRPRAPRRVGPQAFEA